MMNQHYTIDPEVLQDYVDDELDSAARLELGQLLAQSPADRERVSDYQQQNEALHRLHDDVLTEAVPERLRRVLAGDDPSSATHPSAPQARRAVPRKRRWHPPMISLQWKRAIGAASACVLLLGLGAASGWKVRGDLYEQYTRDMAVDAFLRQATDSYSLYTAEQTPWGSSSGASDIQPLLSWFKDALGVEVTAPSLDEAGYEFAGGRALPSTTGPAGQFLYRNGEGATIAIYFQVKGANDARRLAPDLHGASGRTFAQRDDLSVYYWESGPLTYALLGAMDKDALGSLADAVHRRNST